MSASITAVQLKLLQYSEGHGWQKQLFVTPVNSYLCGCCKHVCKDAVELACEDVEHGFEEIEIYCTACLQQLIQENNDQCPISNHMNVKFVGARNIRRRVLNSKVVCPNSAEYKQRLLQSMQNDNNNNNIENNNNSDHAQYMGTPFGPSEDTAHHTRYSDDEHRHPQCTWRGTFHDLIENHLCECVNDSANGNTSGFQAIQAIRGQNEKLSESILLQSNEMSILTNELIPERAKKIANLEHLMNELQQMMNEQNILMTKLKFTMKYKASEVERLKNTNATQKQILSEQKNAISEMNRTVSIHKIELEKYTNKFPALQHKYMQMQANVNINVKPPTPPQPPPQSQPHRPPPKTIAIQIADNTHVNKQSVRAVEEVIGGQQKKQTQKNPRAYPSRSPSLLLWDPNQATLYQTLHRNRIRFNYSAMKSYSIAVTKDAIRSRHFDVFEWEIECHAVGANSYIGFVSAPIDIHVGYWTTFLGYHNREFQTAFYFGNGANEVTRFADNKQFPTKCGPIADGHKFRFKADFVQRTVELFDNEWNSMGIVYSNLAGNALYPAVSFSGGIAEYSVYSLTEIPVRIQTQWRNAANQTNASLSQNRPNNVDIELSSIGIGIGHGSGRGRLADAPLTLKPYPGKFVDSNHGSNIVVIDGNQVLMTGFVSSIRLSQGFHFSNNANFYWYFKIECTSKRNGYEFMGVCSNNSVDFNNNPYDGLREAYGLSGNPDCIFKGGTSVEVADFGESIVNCVVRCEYFGERKELKFRLPDSENRLIYTIALPKTKANRSIRTWYPCLGLANDKDRGFLYGEYLALALPSRPQRQSSNQRSTSLNKSSNRVNNNNSATFVHYQGCFANGNKGSNVKVLDKQNVKMTSFIGSIRLSQGFTMKKQSANYCWYLKIESKSKQNGYHFIGVCSNMSKRFDKAPYSGLRDCFGISGNPKHICKGGGMLAVLDFGFQIVGRVIRCEYYGSKQLLQFRNAEQNNALVYTLALPTNLSDGRHTWYPCLSMANTGNKAQLYYNYDTAPTPCHRISNSNAEDWCPYSGCFADAHHGSKIKVLNRNEIKLIGYIAAIRLSVGIAINSVQNTYWYFKIESESTENGYHFMGVCSNLTKDFEKTPFDGLNDCFGIRGNATEVVAVAGNHGSMIGKVIRCEYGANRKTLTLIHAEDDKRVISSVQLPSDYESKMRGRTHWYPCLGVADVNNKAYLYTVYPAVVAHKRSSSWLSKINPFR